jgi:GTPase
MGASERSPYGGRMAARKPTRRTKKAAAGGAKRKAAPKVAPKTRKKAKAEPKRPAAPPKAPPAREPEAPDEPQVQEEVLDPSLESGDDDVFEPLSQPLVEGEDAEEGDLDDALFDGQQQAEDDEAEPEEPDTLERDPAARPPVVAIVGRPNVGKSTLLNALSGSRISIVEPTPGVTRDRVGVLCTLADRTVELVDTGGVGIVDAQGLGSHVEDQVGVAVEAAAVILFVLDAREGVEPLDERVAGMLRRAASRVVVVANKAETQKVGWNVGEIEGLGFGEPVVVSAQERTGLDELEERVAARLPTGPTTPRRLPPPEMKLAFVGRVNAGKSSIVNALLRQQRMIVSSVPGTTRDSVDVRFERDGKSFVVIDTAGIRKEKSVQGGLDFYAQRRAERAMRRADISALVLDATADVSRLDRRIAGYALEHHHPVMIVVNKWDLRPPDLTTGRFAKYVRATLRGLDYAPIVYTTATDGRNVDALVDVARGLFRQATTRVKTAQLNKAILHAQTLKAPRPYHGRQGQIYFGTQVDVRPPTFVLFVNDPALFDSTYRRYLENQFRAILPMPEVPVRIFFKARERSPSKNDLGPIER